MKRNNSNLAISKSEKVKNVSEEESISSEGKKIRIPQSTSRREQKHRAVDNAIIKAQNVIELVNNAKAKMDNLRKDRDRNLVKDLDLREAKSQEESSDEDKINNNEKNFKRKGMI